MAFCQPRACMASRASPYRRSTDQLAVSSGASCVPLQPASASAAAASRASTLVRMGRDYTDADDNADWDASFVAPMSAEAPRALAGLRLDQALARMFPQYSRSRLQAWLAAGHITVDGARAAARPPGRRRGGGGGGA